MSRSFLCTILVKISVNCGPAPEIANGLMSSTTPGLVKYGCEDGWKLADEEVNQLHCEDGSWSTENGKFPTCAPVPSKKLYILTRAYFKAETLLYRTHRYLGARKSR